MYLVVTGMFTSGLREKDAAVVKLHDFCPSVMSKLLSFMYTGEIMITPLVVCQVLPAACMLQVVHNVIYFTYWYLQLDSIIDCPCYTSLLHLSGESVGPEQCIRNCCLC